MKGYPNWMPRNDRFGSLNFIRPSSVLCLSATQHGNDGYTIPALAFASGSESRISIVMAVPNSMFTWIGPQFGKEECYSPKLKSCKSHWFRHLTDRDTFMRLMSVCPMLCSVSNFCLIISLRVLMVLLPETSMVTIFLWSWPSRQLIESMAMWVRSERCKSELSVSIWGTAQREEAFDKKIPDVSYNHMQQAHDVRKAIWSCYDGQPIRYSHWNLFSGHCLTI